MSGPTHRLPGGKGYLRPSTGEVFPGVTTVIKALDGDPGALIGWATKTTAQEAVRTMADWQHLSTAEEAEALIKSSARKAQSVKRDIGTAVHAAVEATLLARLEGGGTPAVHPKVQPYMDGLESFLEETGFTPLGLEVTVLDPEAGYAGTLDAVGQVGQEIVLVDWKTGGLRSTMAAQMLLLERAPLVLHDDGTETVFAGADALWIVQVTPRDYTIHEVTRDGALAERLAYVLPQVSDLARMLDRVITRRPEPVRL